MISWHNAFTWQIETAQLQSQRITGRDYFVAFVLLDSFKYCCTNVASVFFLLHPLCAFALKLFLTEIKLGFFKCCILQKENE